MRPRAEPALDEGRVYRTRDLAQWGTNAPRLARRLVAEGQLVELSRGLFVRPRQSRFGPLPPSDEELMRGLLDGAPHVFTGPARWNALGLGTTALFADTLVYNTKRSGRFELAGRPFLLRRVAFPVPTPVEWFVVDLLEHATQAASSREEVAVALTGALTEGRFDRPRLLAMADQFGTRETLAHVQAALRAQAA